MSEEASREPILGINPYDTSYGSVAQAIDSQGWLIAATLLEEPAAFRHSEFGDEQITVYLSSYEAGRVLHLSYGLRKTTRTRPSPTSRPNTGGSTRDSRLSWGRDSKAARGPSLGATGPE